MGVVKQLLKPKLNDECQSQTEMAIYKSQWTFVPLNIILLFVLAFSLFVELLSVRCFFFTVPPNYVCYLNVNDVKVIDNLRGMLKKCMRT